MTPYRRRAGFTLIELLVVIAILSAMAALAAGTYFRIRQAQTDTASERIVVRLSTGLERLIKGVVDQAKQEVREDRVPNGVRALSRVWPVGATAPTQDIDRDRLVGIWAYLKLKAELPQTFDEARAGVWISAPTGAGVPTVPPLGPVQVVAPKGTFVTAARAGLTTTTTPPLSNANSGVILLNLDTGARDYALEAAALLYAALAERGVRGELAGDEIGGPTTADQETGFAEVLPDGQLVTRGDRIRVRVFRDAGGIPISFVRHATNEVIAAPPSASDPPAVDPIDPEGRLRVYPVPPLPAGTPDNPWNPRSGAANACLLAFHAALRHPTQPAGPLPQAFPNPLRTGSHGTILPRPAPWVDAWAQTAAPFPGGQRWVTTVLSAGVVRNFDALNIRFAEAFNAQSVLVTAPRDTGYIFSHEAR